MRSMKGVMNSSFRRALCTKAAVSKKSAEMQCLRKLLQVLTKSLIKTFQNVSERLYQGRCINALYERSNKQLLS